MIYLYSHGGSENHGCEAIVRSTCDMLQNKITLYSNHIEQDQQYCLEQVCNLLSDEVCTIQRGSKEWLLSSLETKLTKKYDLAVKYQHKALISQVRQGDVYLSVGGDNYCYEGTDILAAMNKALRAKGAKTVLWGCSVEPKLLENPSVAKDLSGFDLITARETISYQALKRINPNTVLVADPAFTLKQQDNPLPDGWQNENMIGINASPLILSSAGNKEIVLQAYHNLIRNILETTDCGIALIPHVVWEKNDDRTVLKLFYDRYKDTGRVVLLEDHNCMELKGYIARCRMFIGARTHATIAAYSNCVPTLVLGYSVKSRGIARDLFGTEENYVLPVQKITDANALANGFQWMLNYENKIQNHLNSNMPDYIQKAYIAKEKLDNLLL
ncbi:MAG: polysaccharide pyruvyl transferase family protein [Anaerostipes faecalis]|nr:polysaccharide pyruvyl transferase family protein [Anaerostipes faecalis]